jgi:hypothetical protein
MPDIQVAFDQDATDFSDCEALAFHTEGYCNADLIGDVKADHSVNLIDQG